MEEVNKEIQEIQNKLKDILDLNEMEDLVKSNEKIFEIEGNTYRVRKASFKQKQESYKRRVERFTELLKDSKYMLEKDLKETYLKRGVNVDDITKEIQLKIKKRNDLMLVLGESLKNKEMESNLQKYKNEIDELNLEIQNLSIKKTSYLEFSIENQVMIDTYSYLTFLVAEKLIKGDTSKSEVDKWMRVWNTWEEFENDKENLVNKFSYYVTMMNSMQEF